MRRESIRIDFPHGEIDLQNMLDWSVNNLFDTSVEHCRHCYSAGLANPSVVDEYLIIEFQPSDSIERALFKLRWSI